MKTLNERYNDYVNSLAGTKTRVMPFPEWWSKPESLHPPILK